jgi:hypothetical protein
VGRPIYSFAFAVYVVLIWIIWNCSEFENLFHLKSVQNLKNCSIWNMFRIWKFVPFEICSEFENCSIWNLFRIWKFVPFEICSEFEKLFHLKNVQNLKICSISNLFRFWNYFEFFINRRNKKIEKENKNKRKREKKALVPIGPARSKNSTSRGYASRWFPTQEVSNRNHRSIEGGGQRCLCVHGAPGARLCVSRWVSWKLFRTPRHTRL